MTEPALEAKDISYSYGEREAVKGISFEVRPGEILGFLGPNGAGKSTTIKVLTGQLAPDSGVARILGMDVAADAPEVQARIGVCFEEKNLYLNMSARENLRFFASLFGIRRPDVDGLLGKVGLADRGTTLPTIASMNDVLTFFSDREERLAVILSNSGDIERPVAVSIYSSGELIESAELAIAPTMRDLEPDEGS